jgi:hypothetical protein
MDVYHVWFDLAPGVSDVEFVEDLSQLQAAFDAVSARADPIESFHHAVNSRVRDVLFALYRDFPDATRVRGQEKF